MMTAVFPEEVLGRGEYGTVCLGVHKPTGRQLAVKVCATSHSL
jgi:serine/threonine protein kinase